MESLRQLDPQWLSDKIIELAAWSKKHPRYNENDLRFIKLPPALLKGDECKNLHSAIHCFIEYWSGNATLNQLPEMYNAEGGNPKVEHRHFRKMHNWMLQTNVAIRVALLYHYAFEKQYNFTQTCSKVYEIIFKDDANTVFIGRQSNQYKPLKYAPKAAVLKWMKQELDQIKNQEKNICAVLSEAEWNAYGLRGKAKEKMEEIQSSLSDFLKSADQLDDKGNYIFADDIDDKIINFAKQMRLIDRNDFLSR